MCDRSDIRQSLGGVDIASDGGRGSCKRCWNAGGAFVDICFMAVGSARSFDFLFLREIQLTPEPRVRQQLLRIRAFGGVELKAHRHEISAVLAEIQGNLGRFVGVGDMEHRRSAVFELAPGWPAAQKLITTATK